MYNHHIEHCEMWHDELSFLKTTKSYSSDIREYKTSLVYEQLFLVSHIVI